MAPKRFFLQQDGATLAFVCHALSDVGFMDALFAPGRGGGLRLRDWAAETQVAEAYLEACARTLVCAGVLERRAAAGGTEVQLTERGRAWRRCFEALAELGGFVLENAKRLGATDTADPAVARALRSFASVSSAGATPDAEYLEGAFLLPLAFFGGERALRAVAAAAGSRAEAVDELVRYAPYSGILFSYLPLYSSLPRLLRSEQRGLVPATKGHAEQHVDRRANVLATGQAHQRYFADADEIFTELFNQTPLEAQPRFVCDMGCGDGTWLARVHQVVRERTLRGRHLQTHPLTMVGVDYNQAALEVSEARLRSEAVAATLLWGDIGDPQRLSEDLAARGLSMSDGLHIRSFIDHNRPYRPPVRRAPDLAGSATGAFIGPSGEPLEPDAVVQSFVEHLERWRPHVSRHGMVLLEAHGVTPEVAWEHRGETTALTFDTHHALSQQYLLEHGLYLACARKAGLEPHPVQSRRYPAAKPFVGISLHRFVAG